MLKGYSVFRIKKLKIKYSELKIKYSELKIK